MQARPQLFDEHLLGVRRDRAMALGFDGRGDFIHRAVAAEIAERLDEIKRDFPSIGLVGTGAGAVGAALAGRWRTLVQREPSRAMREAAARRLPRAETAPGWDTTLGFGESRLDLALSVLVLHGLNDPVGHLVQLRRALRPDGLMIAALFGGQTLHELRAALAEAEAEIAGGLSPRVAPMGEIRDLGGLLQRAGLAMPVADSQRFDVRYETPLELMRDLRAMGETNILTARPRAGMGRALLDRACEIYARHFSTGDGRVHATFEVIYLTGWAPAPDQPQPLRPGSATTRLADALGSEEQSAGEKTGPSDAPPGRGPRY